MVFNFGAPLYEHFDNQEPPVESVESDESIIEFVNIKYDIIINIIINNDIININIVLFELLFELIFELFFI